jgi:hypothetical protein
MQHLLFEVAERATFATGCRNLQLYNYGLILDGDFGSFNSLRESLSNLGRDWHNRHRVAVIDHYETLDASVAPGAIVV